MAEKVGLKNKREAKMVDGGEVVAQSIFPVFCKRAPGLLAGKRVSI